MRIFFLCLGIFLVSLISVAAQQPGSGYDAFSERRITPVETEQSALSGEHKKLQKRSIDYPFHFKQQNYFSAKFGPIEAYLDGDEQIFYEYGSNGFLLSEIIERKNGEGFEKSERYTYTFQEDGLLLMRVHEKWVEGTVQNVSRTNITYSLAGLPATILEETWGLEGWVNSKQYIYLYDGSNHLQMHYESVWANGAWQNSKFSVYTYHPSGFRATQTTQVWKRDVWTNDLQFAYDYDGAGNKIAEFIFSWSSDIWFQTWQGTFEYDNRNRLSFELWEQWEQNGNYRIDYDYDVYGLLIQTVEKYLVSGTWIDNYKYTYVNDRNNNAELGKSYKWRSGVWQANEQGDPVMHFNKGDDFIKYQDVAEVSVMYDYIADAATEAAQTEAFTVSQNYPNPFNPAATIQYALPVRSTVIVSVYNTAGEKIAELLNSEMSAGSHEITWNAGSLPSGMYFIRVVAITDEGKIFTETIKATLLK